MGQFFEQGYGKASNDWTEEESALDILPIPYGLALCGWISHENGKRMALWQTDTLGRLYNFAQHGTNAGYDQIAAALALSHSGNYLLTGRQTDFFVDSQRHSLQNTDLAALKYLGPNGDLLWEYTTDSSGSDTGTVAVDVVYTGQGEFTVLLNLVWGETPRYAYRLLHIDSTGQTLWQETHQLSNTEIFAEKLLYTGGGITVLVNRLDNPAPMLWQHTAQGAYSTHSTYTQAHDTWGYGLTTTPLGYAIAGKEYDGSYYSGSLIQIAANLSQTSHSTHKNTVTGNSWYEDLTAHPTGFLAIGQCDNKGEGQQDVWICHTDTLGDTLKTETLGGTDTDYGHAVVLVPQLFSAFIAGYNNSYGITESGNAYLGGVKVDMGLPEVEEACKVPRVLWVDKFLQRPDAVEALILGDPTEESNLIQFALDNEITHLALFNLGLIFDNHNDHHQYILNSKIAFKAKLDTFITNCKANGIYCGMVTDTTLAAMLNAAGYNKYYFNYTRAGKLNFEILEHEFWNGNSMKRLSGTLPFQNPPSSADLANNNQAQNLHFDAVWQDHKNAIDTLNQFKSTNGNFWQVYDYLGHLYNRWDDDTTLNYYWHSNDTSQSQKADYLEKHLDGIFLHYYTKYSYNNGLDFLNDSTSSYWDVPRYSERLWHFGQQTDTTLIIPIFSAEYYENGSDFCGQGIGTDFLGKYLDDATGNNLKAVEAEYISQHTSKYNSSNYPRIKKLNVGALSWFKYSCLQGYDFASYQNTYDNTRISCPSFTYFPLSDNFINYNQSDILLFPNPTSNHINIVFKENRESEIHVIDAQGRSIISLSSTTSNNVIDLTSYLNGLYFISVNSNNSVKTFKVVKQ